MAHTQLLTAYCCDAGLESIEVELDGEVFVEHFTEMMDLYVSLLFRNLDEDVIREIISDVHRARTNGWCDYRPPGESALAASEAVISCLKWTIAVLLVVVGALFVWGQR